MRTRFREKQERGDTLERGIGSKREAGVKGLVGTEAHEKKNEGERGRDTGGRNRHLEKNKERNEQEGRTNRNVTWDKQREQISTTKEGLGYS